MKFDITLDDGTVVHGDVSSHFFNYDSNGNLVSLSIKGDVIRSVLAKLDSNGSWGIYDTDRYHPDSPPYISKHLKKCSCDIRDLMASGHQTGCPDKK